MDAANYSATHLHVNVGLHEDIVKNPAEALKCSFQKTDEMFLFKAKREVSGYRLIPCYLNNTENCWTTLYYPENSSSTVSLNHWLIYEIMLHVKVFFDQIISFFVRKNKMTVLASSR